ncbi:putative transcriptional regulator [Caulobacter sp. AP07]|uniref:winged helix-turn-helix transcriptional regulator n=1 Tax=Caulobacter sp. AP07 TaxID=1144304 RepID=UPI0002721B96|nr:helix-turn-helix domain-containing protein [Caulobacter sp. AP07]EJL24982.1 putative transcriptional regulator [Caulobacter sp. AP07]
MTRRTFDPGQCPVGRTLERVGDTWSLMILRDAFHGLSRFDQFEQSLGVAPNILSKRLAALVEAGFLERRPYQARPVRHEYVLTALGRDFVPVLTALMAFGNRHFAVEGLASQMVEVASGLPADPVVVDRRTGLEIDAARFTVAAGPAAQAPTRERMALVEARRRARLDAV